MRSVKITVFAWLLVTANQTHASDPSDFFEPVLLPEEVSGFVATPTILSGFVGITPGVIVGVPLAAVGGTLTTLVEGNPAAGATAGMFVGVVGGFQIFSNAIGVPLWAAQRVFYDLPNAVFSNETAKTNRPQDPGGQSEKHD